MSLNDVITSGMGYCGPQGYSTVILFALTSQQRRGKVLLWSLSRVYYRLVGLGCRYYPSYAWCWICNSKSALDGMNCEKSEIIVNGGREDSLLGVTLASRFQERHSQIPYLKQKSHSAHRWALHDSISHLPHPILQKPQPSTHPASNQSKMHISSPQPPRTPLNIHHVVQMVRKLPPLIRIPQILHARPSLIPPRRRRGWIPRSPSQMMVIVQPAYLSRQRGYCVIQYRCWYRPWSISGCGILGKFLRNEML